MVVLHKCEVGNLIFGVVFFNLVFSGASLVKTWKEDKDLLNPDHWVKNSKQEDCQGLDLTEIKGPFKTLVVDDLNATGIFFPKDISVTFPEGTHLNFPEHRPDIKLNCVRIKEKLDKTYSWADPENWQCDELDDNVAVPDLERLPCNHDDVVFPKGRKSLISDEDDYFLGPSVTLKSIRIGSRYLKSYLDDDERPPEFPMSFSAEIFVDDKSCEDPTGCVCGSYISETVCSRLKRNRQTNCLDPVSPINFCGKICGAYILIKTTSDNLSFNENLRIDKLQKALGVYSSDTYVSKVVHDIYLHHNVVQVVFAEKTFTGVSLDEAKGFYQILREDKSLETDDIKLFLSGPLYIKGKYTSNTLGLIFGTLFAVLSVFLILFFVHSETYARFTRHNFVSTPISTLFARYTSNTENEGLIFERASSVAGSVISLDKSFDNPMYGSTGPSKASTSSSTVAGISVGRTKSETSVENPLYNVSTLNRSISEEEETEEVTEENQLMDIMPSEE